MTTETTDESENKLTLGWVDKGHIWCCESADIIIEQLESGKFALKVKTKKDNYAAVGFTSTLYGTKIAAENLWTWYCHAKNK